MFPPKEPLIQKQLGLFIKLKQDDRNNMRYGVVFIPRRDKMGWDSLTDRLVWKDLPET